MQNKLNYYLTTNNNVVTQIGKKVKLVPMVYNDPTLVDCPIIFKNKEEALNFANNHNIKNPKVVVVKVEWDEDDDDVEEG